MKTSKSPENTEITPSKKKLKQARLPFKLISDVSPKPAAPQTRKRKLSAPDTESITKVGKICKENDIIEDPVVISDDDSKGAENPKPDVSMNPFVKLVDTAWKKKLQKSRKKKAGKKKSLKTVNGSVEGESGNDSADKDADSEMMEVDEPSSEVNGCKSEGEETEPTKDTEAPSKEDITETKVPIDDEAKGDEAVVVLEDSNNPDDVKQTDDAEQNGSDDDDEENMSQNEDLDCSTVEESANDTSASKSSKSPSKKAIKGQTTPKRSSARNKAKAEQNNNSKASPSSKLNDSVCSNPTTPKQTPKTSRSSSVTNSQGDVSINESTPSTNLTPKQVQKKLESAKKREEREKEKQERERKKQQEKEERAKIRQEKEDQKKKEREEKEEAKRKEKEEKEEQRRKEKEEKERLKEFEKKQKEEKEEQKRKEREEKEEQRKKEKEAREEEKRKKQEALELEKQEQELKKKKAAEAFVNFFVPKQKSEKEQATDSCISKTSMLSNFMIKNDMRLAPLVRVDLSEEKKEDLVSLIQKQTVSEKGLYLKCLKEGTSKPLSSGKTWPLSDKDDDVMIVEDELPMPDDAGEILTCESVQREKLRPKLLSFHENRRPPYWGTWRKKSASVKPRRPFGQDEKQLDYEVDSDEEWEEEQEGESIDGSAAGSDDEQDADEYEVDNEVFVPHGYLSDEEATMDEDDMLSLSPEAQKQRLKHLEDEFESEMKKPTEKLKPRMYGLLWETADGGKPEKCVDALWNYFGKLSMIMNDPTPFFQPASEPEETEKKKVKKKKVPKETTDGEPKPKSPKNEKKKKAKTEDKESKTPKSETKKNVPETKKNQPGINMFLTKLKSS
uniref:Chromatin assembly factor 1 subunit A dimerization domain-containing protein n=1 Tax=Heliothis virescens TaxID=7102 RepID=A0A2A4K782_HELVI